MILFLLAAMLASPPPASSHVHDDVVQQRRFDASEQSCVLTVFAVSRPTNANAPAPDQSVTIACNKQTVFTHDFEDADIGNIVFYDDYIGHLRISVPWERGTGSGLTIIEVVNNQFGVSANVLFDYFSKCGAEILDYGDVILANVGKRFIGANIVPTGTNVYRWKDGKYVFDRGLRWNDDARWNDRYCILFKPESCPAEATKTPLPKSE